MDTPAETKTRRESQRKRGLFEYHDGVRTRVGDVLEIQLRLQEASPGGDISAMDRLLELVAGDEAQEAQEAPTIEGDPAPAPPPNPTQSPVAAVAALVPVISAGFALPDFDETCGTGLSWRERIELLTAFLTDLVANPETDLDDPTTDGKPTEFVAEFGQTYE